MNTTEFIALCDRIPAENRPSSNSGRALDEDRIRIKDALTPVGNEGIAFSEFKNLRTGFVYLQSIDQSKDYSPYFYILEKISEHFNGSTDRIADWSTQVWRDVIAYAKSLPEYPRTDAFSSEFQYVKERERANAALRLTAYGVKVSLVDCGLKIENTEIIYTQLEKWMREIGGEHALHLLLSELVFIKDIGRFLVPHQGGQTLPNYVELEKPYGFLLNLCLKHFKEKGSSTDVAQKWDGVCALVTDLFVAVYNSQKYDIWSHIIYNPREAVKVVHEMMLSFNLYFIPQTIVSFALDWSHYLCKWVKRDARCVLSLKAKLDSAEQIMNWAANVSNNSTCTHIKKRSKNGRFIASHMVGIEDQLLLSIDNLNANFHHPEDINKVNSVRFPILVSDEDYILLPKTIVMWNWYEAIFNIIRCNNSSLSKDIGYVMEDYIHNKMRTLGIRGHTGQYEYDTIAGEVDFLIEATQADAYIESKKKSFSLKAQGGDDYYTWGDMYEFLESQMQCARLESGVRNHGPIEIENRKTGEKYLYDWKGFYYASPADAKKEPTEHERYVVKATMTLKEYGPMQDKLVMMNILKSLIGKEINARFEPTDTAHNADDQSRILNVFNKINDVLKALADYYKAIGDKNPTFFCRLYSMEQIYFLIKEAKSQDHFVELLTGGLVTTGTECFWNEYLNSKNIIKMMN